MKKLRSLRFLVPRLQQFYLERTQPDAPWLVKSSYEILNQLIMPQDVGLEFGSGRSTKWLARRCNFLYSIEHDENWYKKVKQELAHLKNVDYRHKSIAGETGKKDYVEILRELEPNSLAFILDDGKCRDEVACQGLDKLQIGGLLIIDNAERYIANPFDLPDSMGADPQRMKQRWSELWDKVSDWRRIWHSNGIFSTLILFKS